MLLFALYTFHYLRFHTYYYIMLPLRLLVARHPLHQVATKCLSGIGKRAAGKLAEG